MKRIIVLIALLLLVGCARVERADRQESSRFVTVEQTLMWRIVADKQTGVIYSVSTGAYSSGVFTLLVDADGKPLIYEGKTE